MLPLDLHVLGLPPAFILSQDQTLQFNLDFAFFESFAALSKLSKLTRYMYHINMIDHIHSCRDFLHLRLLT